jgi:hypothetical protein
MSEPVKVDLTAMLDDFIQTQQTQLNALRISIRLIKQLKAEVAQYQRSEIPTHTENAEDE